MQRGRIAAIADEGVVAATIGALSSSSKLATPRKFSGGVNLGYGLFHAAISSSKLIYHCF